MPRAISCSLAGENLCSPFSLPRDRRRRDGGRAVQLRKPKKASAADPGCATVPPFGEDVHCFRCGSPLSVVQASVHRFGRTDSRRVVTNHCSADWLLIFMSGV